MLNKYKIKIIIKKINILLILFFTISISLFSEENDINDKKNEETAIQMLDLDLNTAVDLGLKNNLNIESEKLTLEKKKWAAITSWNTFIPSMTISPSIARANNREASTVTEIIPVGTSTNGVYDQVTKYSYDVDQKELILGIDFNLSLTINAKMFFSIYSTILDYRNGKIGMETAKKQLIRDIKKKYYNLLLLQKKIILAEESLESEKKTYEQALVDYKHGLKTEYDLLSAQVSYEILKPDLLNARNNYNYAILSFKHILGLKDNVSINFMDNIEVIDETFDSDELISKYISSRLDIKSLNFEKKSLINQRNSYIGALTPSFTFSYTADPKLQHDLTKPEDWEHNLDDDWKQTAGSINLAVSFPLDSLFPFSTYQMNLINNKIALEQKELQIKNMELTAKEEIKKSVLTLQKSIKSQEYLKLNVNLAQKAYNLAGDSYSAGTKDILNLQDAKNKLEKAKVSLLEEEVNCLLTFIDLEYQINNDLKK